MSKINLEHDLYNTVWICKKVMEDDTYAQNLYAAMCNVQFQKLEVVPILKEEFWSCSWRYAGAIIANMRGEGDYLNWYCSGIYQDSNGHVPEGTITKEIREDLKKLGWRSLPWEDDTP